MQIFNPIVKNLKPCLESDNWKDCILSIRYGEQKNHIILLLYNIYYISYVKKYVTLLLLLLCVAYFIYDVPEMFSIITYLKIYYEFQNKSSITCNIQSNRFCKFQ